MSAKTKMNLTVLIIWLMIVVLIGFIAVIEVISVKIATIILFVTMVLYVFFQWMLLPCPYCGSPLYGRRSSCRVCKNKL